MTFETKYEACAGCMEEFDVDTMTYTEDGEPLCQDCWEEWERDSENEEAP